MYRGESTDEARAWPTALEHKIRVHLGVVFHRLLAAESVHLKVAVEEVSQANDSLGVPVQPIDPFGYRRSGHPDYPKELIADVEGHKVSLQCHIWPGRSDLTGFRIGGAKGEEHQGFFVYRIDRLLQVGGWAGIATASTSRQLARVVLDDSDVTGRFVTMNSEKQGLRFDPVFSEALSRTRADDGTTFVARLKKLWDEDFHPVMLTRAGGEAMPPDFDSLREHIAEAYAAMSVDGDPILIVNSNKQITEQQRKLDFEEDDVWRILVGGAQLSRGFTTEGLTISYYRRKTFRADTLMQAGRWFGFRPGYQDLVRLYIRRDAVVDLYEAFEALLMDEEAFREEVRQYEGFDENGIPIIEPRQVPPLVSQHLPWPRPTARNKMWNAVIESKATALQFRDLYGLPPREDRDSLQSNLTEVGLPLLNKATEPITLSYEIPNASSGRVEARCGLIDAALFRSLTEKMHRHPDYREHVDPVMRFMDKAIEDGRLRDLLVVWPQARKRVQWVDLPELSPSPAPVVVRNRRPGRIDFIGSDAKHRAAALPVTRGEDIAGMGASQTRGAIPAYLVDDRPVEPSSGERLGRLQDPGALIVLFSLASPERATPRKRDLIQWTVRAKSAESEVSVSGDRVTEG